MHKEKLLKKITDNVTEVSGASSFSEYAATILVKELIKQGREKSAQRVIENYEARFGKSKALNDLLTLTNRQHLSFKSR